MTQYLQGPYRTLSLGAAGTPWYMISYDRRGRSTSPRTCAEIVDRVEQGAFTDVVLFSHGWNNDWIESTSRYESFIGGCVQQLSEYPPPGDALSTLLVGVFWPSKILVAGKDNPAAAALTAYLKTDKARAIIRSFGYEF